MQDTKVRLMQAALVTVREQGLASTSARTIATRADANQALIFYHFHTVAELLEAASNSAIDDSVAEYRDAFAHVGTLSELLALGRELHGRERDNGNVALMAQLMSGAVYDPVLARACKYAMDTWTHEITGVLHRVLADNPIAQMLDTDGLAHAISAGFIGLELYEGVYPVGATQAFSVLEELGAIIDGVNDLGPVATRALRGKLRATAKHRAKHH